MYDRLIYLIGLALSFYVAWCLGANDAANPTSCTVGSGALDMKRAILLFALFTAIGALLQGFMVMKTIDRGIVPQISILGAFTSILAVCIWITISSWKGMPVSTTHSIVGAVVGYGLIAGGTGGISWNVVIMVLIAMIISPLIAIFLSGVLYKGFKRLFERMAEKTSKERVEKRMKQLVIASLCVMAYAFGANDVGNATGIFVTATKEIGGIPGSTAMLLLAVLAVFGIAIGGMTFGSRVIETSGRQITRLNYLMAAPAELTNALAVLLFTTVPYLIWGWGLPVSTTHASIGAIIGVGLVAGGTGVNRETIKKITGAWLITLPVTAIMSIVLYKIASLIIV